MTRAIENHAQQRRSKGSARQEVNPLFSSALTGNALDSERKFAASDGYDSSKPDGHGELRWATTGARVVVAGKTFF